MQRIYNSVEDVNKFYGVDLKLPNNIPEGCNVICYRVESLYSLRPFNFYQESEGTLYYFATNNWCDSMKSNLVEEVVADSEDGISDLIYLRLNEKKDKYTPARLLGVETDHGYITDAGFRYAETTTGDVYCTRDDLKFYISDDNDETVSFDEYVDMFYER